MEQLLSSRLETKDIKLLRVKAYESLNDINLQIDEVIREIKQRAIEYDIDKWDIYKNPVDHAIKNWRLSVSDNLLFDQKARYVFALVKIHPERKRIVFMARIFAIPALSLDDKLYDFEKAIKENIEFVHISIESFKNKGESCLHIY